MSERIRKPNYTQLPNVVLDSAKDLKEGELRVMLLMCRETFGWHRDTARLSITRIQTLTGMSRQGVVTALDLLMEREWISRSDPTQSGYLYMLSVNEVDTPNEQVVNLVDQQVVNLVDPSKESIKEKNSVSKDTVLAPKIDYDALLTAIPVALKVKGTLANRYASMLIGTAKVGEWKECAMPKEAPVTAEELHSFAAWWKKHNPTLNVPTTPLKLQSELLKYRDVKATAPRRSTPRDTSNSVFGGAS